MMKTKTSLIPFAVGLGLTLALLCLLVLSQVEGLASSAAPARVQSATHYVAPAGDCGGVNPCYSTVQAAVDAAQPGDEIHVATGVYTGVQARAGITQVVYISKTVTVRGGYTITNWATPDPVAHPTTLDAQGQGRVLVISGTITPTLEGLRITAGDAAGLGGGPWDDDDGGGLYIYTATATISGCMVYSNTANRFGGGLYLDNSDATLEGNTVISNTAYAGGGLYLWKGAATLEGNTVISNTASPGGGLYLDHSDTTLAGNIVSGNTASVGGGLYLWDGAVTLEGNTVSGNTAYSDGGGLYLWDAAITLAGNIVSGNTASAGGGLYMDFSDATLRDNMVQGNTASAGGGLHLSYSNAMLDNNLVIDNQVSSSGAGLYVSGSAPRLRHNTVVHNAGGDGGGVYITNSSTVVLTNTILVSHTVGVTVTAGSTATLEATLWYSNGTHTGGAGTILTGTINVYGDPAFVNPAAWDYHLGPGSAAIDAGVDAGVTTDIDGEPRPQGLGYDIGADELFNRQPISDAGSLQTALTGASVTLDGSASSDPDGDPLTYGWAQTGGPSVSFTPNLSVTTFTAPATAGVLTFALIVTDPFGLSDSDVTTVTVEPYRICLPIMLRNS